MHFAKPLFRSGIYTNRSRKHACTFQKDLRCCYANIYAWFGGPSVRINDARNDKYSSKVYRYFVEYSDKESVKKSRIEAEKTTSTEEA